MSDREWGIYPFGVMLWRSAYRDVGLSCRVSFCPPSAPCLPGNVVAQLNCSSNEFAVQWQGSLGLESYTALAIGSDGYRTSCNTSATACTIADLHCGQVYSIAVVTSSVQCGQIQGSDYMVMSGGTRPRKHLRGGMRPRHVGHTTRASEWLEH